MTLKGFIFIIISALFHVLWNSMLKTCRDKTSAIFLMMCVTVTCMGGIVLFLLPHTTLWIPGVFTSALAAGFFFFLYQHFVALSLEKGDLTLVYPLTVTGPVYIALWGYLLMGERISPMGGTGILLIIYGAVTLQRGRLVFLHERVGIPNILSKFVAGGPWSEYRSARGRYPKPIPGKFNMGAGALPALAAAFFYSFGAVADKLGVMTGNVFIYTFHLSLYMLLFHLIRVLWQHQTHRIISEVRHSPRGIVLGGLIMLFSFVTFRMGLETIQASYASALRQVSTLFGMGIGFLFFKEKVTLARTISALIIAVGAALIKSVEITPAFGYYFPPGK